MTVTTTVPAHPRFAAPALHRLRIAAAHCVALARHAAAPDADVEAERRLHTLFVAVLACEAAGVADEDVADAVQPVRAMAAAAPLFRRLQALAPGAAPDHATIEALCAGRSTARAGTLAHLFDTFLLRSPIARQLRHRVAWREALLLEALLARGGASARALVLDAGPALDVRAVARRVRFAPEQVTVHDADPAAVAHALGRLGAAASGVRFVTGDARRAAADLAADRRFDLVVLGDALDRLDDRDATALLRVVHEGLLAPGGRLALGAASAHDPLRPCLDHLTAWQPVRRTPDDLARLLGHAGMPGTPTVAGDGSGLALLAEITRPRAARRAA